MSVPTLIITGTVGVGKSAVAAEINDVLALLEIPNAAVDVDALVWQWPSSAPWNGDLAFENLAALWPNYHAHGATRLILARVVEERSELERYRTAIPDAVITVCRLTAPEGLRRRRLETRMPPGESLDWHLRRTVELEELLEAGQVEDFAVDNGERPIREVAIEVMLRSDWISHAQAASI
jgi:adenylylsulfate kinase